MRAEDLIESTDDELIKLIFKHWTDAAVINTAQAELTRRQIEAVKTFRESTENLERTQTSAINRFNDSSSRLSRIMIGLTVAIGAIALVQLVVFLRT